MNRRDFLTAMTTLAVFASQPKLALANSQVDFSTPAGQLQMLDWATRASDAVARTPIINGNNRFTGSINAFHGDGVTLNASAILLDSGYNTVVDVRKASRNELMSASAGGNAALYLQHRIDNSTAKTGTANIGIRAQVETYQQSTAGLTNDAVTFYGGLYNGGVDVGGFGVHMDLYHAATGANCSSYGQSVESFRITNAGFVAAFHARVIHNAAYFDTDFAFLASPSGGGGAGTRKFLSVFAAGSVATGVLNCDIGLNLAQSTCNTAACVFPNTAPIVWNVFGASVGRLFFTGGSELQFSVNGVRSFACDISGNGFFSGNLSVGGTSMQVGGADVCLGVAAGVAGALTGNAVTFKFGGTTFKVPTCA